MADMFDKDPEERMKELDAREAALLGTPAADDAKVTEVEKEAGAEAPKTDEPKKFTAGKLGEEEKKAEEANPDLEALMDYNGIEIEGIDYPVPQVDMDGGIAAREKAAKGEELTDKEKTLVSEIDFYDQLKDYGLDWNEITVDYHKGGGKLSDEMYGKLTTVFPKPLVDNYMSGVDDRHRAFLANRDYLSTKKERDAAELTTKQAEAEKKASEENRKVVLEAVGGEDALGKLNDWVTSGGLTKDELEAVNETLRTEDPFTVKGRYALKTIMENVQRKYFEANGKEEVLLTGDTPSPRLNEAPLSKSDFQAIIATKEYRNDPIYAAKIDARRIAGKKKGL